MNDALIAAIINVRVAEANIILESYRAANAARLVQDHFPAYSEDEFVNIIEGCGLHWNAVIGFVNDNRD